MHIVKKICSKRGIKVFGDYSRNKRLLSEVKYFPYFFLKKLIESFRQINKTLFIQDYT